MLDRDGGHSQGMDCFLEPFKSFPRGSCLCIRHKAGADTQPKRGLRVSCRDCLRKPLQAPTHPPTHSHRALESGLHEHPPHPPLPCVCLMLSQWSMFALLVCDHVGHSSQILGRPFLGISHIHHLWEVLSAGGHQGHQG